MIKSRTTLILGAGASAPYGFPIGSELRDDLLKTDSEFNVKLKEASLSAKAWVEIQDLLHRFQPTSVDDFLRIYPEHADMMKLAIAYQLNRHERVKEHQDPNHRDPWYRVLLDDVLDNDPQLGAGILSIVTFNYDMSLEAYLSGTLEVRHRLEEEEANAALGALNVQHIYGAIGPALKGNRWSRPYGKFPSTRSLQTAANGISTCFEPKSREAVATARSLIKESQYVLFLGFGFSVENLKRLDLRTCIRSDAHIVASVYECPGASVRLKAALGPVAVTTHTFTDSGGAGTAVRLARTLFSTGPMTK